METEEGIEVNETKKSKKRKAYADGENVKEKKWKEESKNKKKNKEGCHKSNSWKKGC